MQSKIELPVRSSAVSVTSLRQAFTIVELLIVVVVIAILAAITIVAYNGITIQAKESSLKSDLRNGATQLGLVRAQTGSYPGSSPDLKASGDNNLIYTGGGVTFCLQATNPSLSGRTMRITEQGSVQDGECAGWGVAAMQSFTSMQCSNLTIYTGSNPGAVISLADSRGGITRVYEVARLADGNCWMLNNLKLGSATGAITLTPIDSDVGSDFILPQLISSGPTNYDAPHAIGPVRNDTAIGSTNYGYLYNFPAATAGETRTSLTAGNAPYSICPAGWKLPTAGWNSDWTVALGDIPDLDRAFGGTGYEAPAGDPSIAKWSYGGPFRGVLSGDWAGGFFDQGSRMGFWSRSADPANSGNAFSARALNANSMRSVNYSDRYQGFSVRCFVKQPS